MGNGRLENKTNEENENDETNLVVNSVLSGDIPPQDDSDDNDNDDDNEDGDITPPSSANLSSQAIDRSKRKSWIESMMSSFQTKNKTDDEATPLPSMTSTPTPTMALQDKGGSTTKDAILLNDQEGQGENDYLNTTTEMSSSEEEEIFDMDDDTADYRDHHHHNDDDVTAKEEEEDYIRFSSLSFLQSIRKTREIISCLDGTNTPLSSSSTDETNVNLWQLRQFALTKGGLLNPSIRKRAWPKLVGIDAKILFYNNDHDEGNNHLNNATKRQQAKRMVQLLSLILIQLKDNKHIAISLPKETKEQQSKGNGTSQNYLDLSNEECDIIQKDVKRSVWHVEQLLSRFAKITDDEEEEQGEDVVANNDDYSLATTLWNVLSFNPPDEQWNKTTTASDQQKNNASSSRQSKVEFEVLRTILTSILQCPPPSSSSPSPLPSPNNTSQENDQTKIPQKDKLHYYQGLHDITSLLLTTIQSPSLTTLLLHRLTSHHLNDAMQSSFHSIHYAIRSTFALLLYNLDYELYSILYHEAGMNDPVFAFSWIVSWFGHDLKDIGVASRLVDVFLASHPLMPVYLSVSVLIHPMNRWKIIHAERDFAILHMTLGSLLDSMDKEGRQQQQQQQHTNSENNDEESSQKTLMDMFEELIEMSLSLIRRIPPKKLFSLAQTYGDDPALSSSLIEMAPSIAMLRDPPAWALASAAPTDWQLVQKKKEMMRLSPIERAEYKRHLSEKYMIMESADAILYHDGKIGKLKLLSRRLWSFIFTSASSKTSGGYYTIAMDAAGLASGLDENDTKGRRRKRRRRRRAVTLVGIAVVGGVVAFHYNTNEQQLQQQPSVSDGEGIAAPLPPEAIPEKHEAIEMEAIVDDSSPVLTVDDSSPVLTENKTEDMVETNITHHVGDEAKLDNFTADILDGLDGDITADILDGLDGEEISEQLLAIDAVGKEAHVSSSSLNNKPLLSSGKACNDNLEEEKEIEPVKEEKEADLASSTEVAVKEEGELVAVPKDRNTRKNKRIRMAVKRVHRFGGFVKESLRNEAQVVFL